jgi:hypothetical protein
MRAQLGLGEPDMQRPTRRQLRAHFESAGPREQAELRKDPEFARLFGGAGVAKREAMVIGSAYRGGGAPVSGTGKPSGAK